MARLVSPEFAAWISSILLVAKTHDARELLGLSHRELARPVACPWRAGGAYAIRALRISGPDAGDQRDLIQR